MNANVHSPARPRHRTPVTLLPALLGICLGVSAGVAAQGTMPVSMRPGDELMVVDCLLPGQVRQLGRMKSFLSARRPIKTTAADCEIRGGEYVAYDRASYGSALKIWLPLAEAGDAEAQTNVGEIFEKGLGVPPDYQAAAMWYQRAAEQGASRAAINLGNLYERGQGVPRDPIQALNWYRRASGLQDAVIMDSGSLNQTREEVASMRAEVQRSREEVEQLRRQLEQARSELDKTRRQLQQRERDVQGQRRKLEQTRASLETQYRSAQSQGDGGKAQALRGELEARERELAARDGELARLRSEIARVAAEAAHRDEQIVQLEAEKGEKAQALGAQVERTEREAEFLRAQLDEARIQLDQARVQLQRQSSETATAATQSARSRQQAAALEERLGEAHGQLGTVTTRLDQTTQSLEAERQQVESLRAQLERERSAATRDEAKVQALEAALAERARIAGQQQTALAALRDQFDKVRGEAQQYRERLSTLIAQRDKEQAQAQSTAQTRRAETVATVEPPRIEMLDPELLATRGPAQQVLLRSAVPAREVVGKVISKVGVMSLTVNDMPGRTNEAGVFRSSVALAAERTPVTIVAVDKQGNRSTLSFDIVREQPAVTQAAASERASEPPPTPREAGIDLGSYHALVIGNDDYNALPRLRTAVADAREVEQLLRTRYGFKTTLVLNATRYQVLSALNDLRENLTDQDNLLIYYAGHGELDRKNLRGHWLPVDAEPSSTANWISNVAITDLLNVMSAKQILVVADSCYSGALTRSALGQLRAGMSAESKGRWMQVMAKKRSRTVLTSGGEQPVLDGAGGKHSVFASAFIEVLRGNTDVLEGGRLFSEVAAKVRGVMKRLNFDQSPEYAPLKYAGHEGGDFFFVPRT
jgi:septal ring factor EnvC (AmiA/AmiB activator)